MSETQSRPLIVTEVDFKALEIVRLLAWQHLVDVTRLADLLATPEGKASHKRQMTSQSLFLAFDSRWRAAIPAAPPFT